MIGAYYFDGWAGRSRLADQPDQAWSRNAPTHLTERMVREFGDREPLWGWRDDTLEIMERQIDLAADHGIRFFAFCWYWRDDQKALNEKAIRQDSLHTSLELFLKARNNRRLQFCLLVANHQGAVIKGTQCWKQAADFWMPYLSHPQHLRVGGKPLLILFDPRGGDREGFAYLQAAAVQKGLPGVAIAGCGGGRVEDGFTHRTHYNVVPGYQDGSHAHPYAELVAAHKSAWTGSQAQPGIPVVTVGWDKRPWEGPTGLKQPEGWHFKDRSPEKLAGFLREAIDWIDHHPEQATKERIVLVYAWNELGEGGYLVPTKGDPEGKYLKAVQAVSGAASVATPGSSAVGAAGSATRAPLAFKRILFLGNSITLHGPSEAVDWAGHWGMAASDQAHDYVHLLTRSLTEQAGTAPETKIENIADFERGGEGFRVEVRLKSALEFDPDLIILAVGENVPALGSEESKAGFRRNLLGLLAAFKARRHPGLLVRSCFWGDPVKDGVLRSVCEEAGGCFVDISALGKDEANYARAERQFKHAGVAAHPGDRGMQAIAEALHSAILRHLAGKAKAE